MGPDPYAILGVDPGAGPEEVRRAWRALVSRYHPDRFATASPEERLEAQAHTAVVNAAYEEIRSGRTRRARASSPGGRATSWDTGSAGSSDTGRAGAADEPWIDPELFRQGVRLLEEQRRRAADRRRWHTRAVLAALLVGVLLLHLSFTRDYGYDVVVDGTGNRYEDVDCGDGYDRGRSAAAALRARADALPDPTALGLQSDDLTDPADLRHQADVVEEVCGEWAELLPPIAVLALPSLGFALWWLFFKKPAAPTW